MIGFYMQSEFEIGLCQQKTNDSFFRNLYYPIFRCIQRARIKAEPSKFSKKSILCIYKPYSSNLGKNHVAYSQEYMVINIVVFPKKRVNRTAEKRPERKKSLEIMEVKARLTRHRIQNEILKID
ncbi:hypothetical protein RF11_13947 [Thelohanellus kitauei]|uniref:Uncharacterized protein n=1 Tax=Thelohanellus kitauei TaxID=669202 RepID=A0A0C2M9H2_THEKT|nr:hypothetical protein RF11_13947 [Thelohanellus kitauei]